MALLTRLASVAAKLDSPAGTYQTPAKEDCIICYDPVVTPEIGMFKRDGFRQWLSRDPSVPGSRAVTVAFKVELKGSGTADGVPDWDLLMKACGFAQTSPGTNILYKPGSAAEVETPYSLNVIHDGQSWSLAGCMGNVRIAGVVGEPMFLEFTFRGKIEAYTALATLVPTALDTTVPPVLVSASFATNIGSSKSHMISAIEFDMQNEIALRPSGNEPEGIDYANITGRNPIGSFDPELIGQGTYDWYAQTIAVTTGTLTLTLGATAGNIITITCPDIKFLGMDPLDREGIRCLTVPFEMNASSGNDEISITQT